MKFAPLMLALSMAGASIASAQSLPPLTKSKAAATKAVNATNDHTRRMTASQDSTADSTRRPVAGRATQASAGSTEMRNDSATFSRVARPASALARLQTSGSRSVSSMGTTSTEGRMPTKKRTRHPE